MPDLTELPPASKIRHLRFDEHMSYAMIAEMYGVSVETVYQLAHESEAVIELVEDEHHT